MIPFEIGDKVKVIGQGIVGDVIDIDYGSNTITIQDAYAETQDDELTYRVDELALVEEDDQESEDVASLDEMRDQEMKNSGYRWEDWN